MKKSTKIEFGFNKVNRIESLDEFSKLLFPSNKNHQKLFLAIFVELKYADNQTLKSLEWMADKYGLTGRVLEIVRAKMRRLGLIDHISKFNKRLSYSEGWVFSNRFSKSCLILSQLPDRFKLIKDSRQEAKDRDLFNYL
jgi:hypothetical protein